MVINHMKIVAIASGGIDSSLMMHMLMENGHEIFPLFINYGQLSYKKEYESYIKICEKFKLKPKSIDISNYGKFFPSGITNRDYNIYEDAFLPNRNLLFLLVGSSYAFQNDIFTVSIGLIGNPIFSDQTKKFLEKAEQCIKESLEVDMKIIAPLNNFDKYEIYNLFNHYNLPLNDTYYCHSGLEVPCGICVACREHLTVQNTKINGAS